VCPKCYGRRPILESADKHALHTSLDDLADLVAGAEALPHAERFRRALAHARRPVSFDELVREVGGADVRLSELVAWLTAARRAGLIEDVERREPYAGRTARRRLVRLSAVGRRVWAR
jgi:hypothetical protein